MCTDRKCREEEIKKERIISTSGWDRWKLLYLKKMRRKLSEERKKPAQLCRRAVMRSSAKNSATSKRSAHVLGSMVIVILGQTSFLSNAHANMNILTLSPTYSNSYTFNIGSAIII